MLKGYKEIDEMAYDDCIEALKTETDEEVRNMLQERLAELEESVFGNVRNFQILSRI